jgi:uncharacterized protein DUF4252
MKTLFRTSLRIAPVLLLLIGGVISARAQGAKLQLDQLDVLANRASNTVDVKIDENLIQTTAKLFKDADEAEIRNVLKTLKGIYVKSFSFEKENEYSPADVEPVLSQVRTGGWSKIVGVKSRKDGENVDVYVMSLSGQISGLAVITMDPKQFTVVNIVGPIDLEKLSELEGSFGIPDLTLSKPKSKKDKDEDQ